MDIQYNSSVRYFVDTTAVHQHIIHIKLEFDAPWDKPELVMPVWTPGSYKIRDYSRYIQSIRASTADQSISLEKTAKNIWVIHVEKGTSVTVEYQVYAFEFTVRTSFLSDRYGLLSPASLFFYLAGSDADNKSSPVWVSIVVSDGWSVFNSMKKEGDFYLADDFDDLIDSPFALAHPDSVETTTYSIDNPDGQIIPCTIALVGSPGNQNLEVFKDAMIKIQQQSIKMFGELPYDRYLWVLYVVHQGGGGLEHRFNNFSIINRWYFDSEKDMNYARMLSLEAHEHFHVYNIKRIRPSQLGPFDYTKEVYTRLLWVAEGMTSFYDNIFLPRSGLIDPQTYWKVIAKDYSSLQKVEGRHHTSITSSSFDAWIKLYQPHSGASNLFVSYYLKGGLVTMMLDLEIRKQSGWTKALDDFFRAMWLEYKRTGEGYEEGKLRELIEYATGTQLSNFWAKYVDGTDDLALNDYLQLVGKTLKVKSEDDPYIGWKLDNNKTKILGVNQGSPAENAGISVGDKLIALNEFEIGSATLEILLKEFSSQKVTIYYFRDGKLRSTVLALDQKKVSEFDIVNVDNPTEEQITAHSQFLQLGTQI